MTEAGERSVDVAERLAEVRRRIAAAAARAGRPPGEVTLVGASKGQPVTVLAAAWRAGLEVFGENRVQEAIGKARELPREIGWHLLGPLQSNKVRVAVELFSSIHSVDRPKIAGAIDQEAARAGKVVAGFLEVNLGGEESKHGFPAAGLAAAVAPLAELRHLRIVGLMTIPPFGEQAELSRPWFRRLRSLRDELARRPEWQGFPGHLSMGMSGDFEVAVEEGATHVRVGTAIFGPRG